MSHLLNLGDCLTEGNLGCLIVDIWVYEFSGVIGDSRQGVTLVVSHSLTYRLQCLLSLLFERLTRLD